MEKTDLLVLGGGPAGLAAAISAYDSGIRSMIVIDRETDAGGILKQCIHNGFGLHVFNEELSGPEYAWRFIEKARERKIDIRTDTMAIDMTSDKKVTVVNPEKGQYKIQAKAIVLAMGCRERTRGALNIPGERPSGIFTAGAAQKFVNIEGYMPGKTVVILGSGDIGLIMARRMTLEGAKVKMVCEVMPYSGGLKRNIVQCLDDFDIPLKLSTTVVEVHGKDRLTGVTIAKVDGKRNVIRGSEEYVECDTLLLSVGLIPENELAKSAGITLDAVTGGAVVNEFLETSVPGVFAAGNILHVHDLVDNVTAEAATAGANAAAFIDGIKLQSKQVIHTKAGGRVRYIVPQRLELPLPEGDKKQRFYFRVDNIYRNVRVVIESGDNTLYLAKKPVVAPGEMEHVDLPYDKLRKLNNDITFRVEAVEG
ncbi:MAG: FAD-dependent oxidoreductase [Bacillota bacterium]|nr:FAD-dependent oxidoreductase [Bacillota bacterium]